MKMIIMLWEKSKYGKREIRANLNNIGGASISENFIFDEAWANSL